MKRVLCPDFMSTAFILIKPSLFMPLLHPAGIIDVIRGGGKPVIHAAPLSHMEVQQSVQPLLASNDGLFEWSGQPLRISGWKKKKRKEDEH